MFNISLGIVAVLFVLGVFLTWRFWGRGAASVTARTLLVLAGIGYLLVAAGPADVDMNMHTLGALFVMPCGNLGLLIAARAFRRGRLAPLALPTLALGVIAFTGTVLHISGYYLMLGMGGAERFAVFVLPIWLVIVGVYILRGKATSAQRSDA